MKPRVVQGVHVFWQLTSKESPRHKCESCAAVVPHRREEKERWVRRLERSKRRAEPVTALYLSEERHGLHRPNRPQHKPRGLG